MSVHAGVKEGYPF